MYEATKNLYCPWQSDVRCLNRSLLNILGFGSKLLISNFFSHNSLPSPSSGPRSLVLELLLIISIVLICAGTARGEESSEEIKFKIPYELLTDDRREEVKKIVAIHTIFRIFKDIEYKTDESILKFMMDHPVFLSATLKAMKIRNYLVKRGTDGMYVFNDRKGIIGKFELIYSAPGKRYYYGFGGYYGMIFKLLGRGALLFEYRGVGGNPSRTYVSANVYTQVDNIVLEILLKILKPIIMPLMDKKIYKFIDETQKLAREITTNPEKVYQVVKESGHVDEKELEEFRSLVL